MNKNFLKKVDDKLTGTVNRFSLFDTVSGPTWEVTRKVREVFQKKEMRGAPMHVLPSRMLSAKEYFFFIDKINYKCESLLFMKISPRSQFSFLVFSCCWLGGKSFNLFLKSDIWKDYGDNNFKFQISLFLVENGTNLKKDCNKD